jgi:hypothetical protein
VRKHSITTTAFRAALQQPVWPVAECFAALATGDMPPDVGPPGVPKTQPQKEPMRVLAVALAESQPTLATTGMSGTKC